MKYALILPLFVCSCSFLHMAPLQVEGWTPEDSLLESIEGVSISLTFSEVPDRIRTEQALQILESGEYFYGKFEWIDDYTIKFKPYEPLKPGQLYTIEAGTGCEDIYGNSLEQPFLHRFSTSSDRTRPEVFGSTPKDGETVFDRAVPISVTFSEAMDWGSLLKSISVSPTLPGSSTISSDLRTFTFIPSALLDWGDEYIITVSEEAADCSGNTLGRKFISRFTLDGDTTAPEILSVSNGSGVFLTSDAPGCQNITSGWEASWKLVVTFSEPVLRDELAARIEFIPPMSFSFEGMPVTQSLEVPISPDAPFVHGTLYQLIITSGYIDEQGNEGIGGRYYFLVDGPMTRPPEISRLTFLQDWADNPGSITDLYKPDGSGGYTSSLAIDLSAYDSGPPAYDKGFFDIYLILADKANQDWDLLRLNLVRNFRIRAGNNCAEIFPLAFQLFPHDPGPVPSPEEIVVRIHTEIFDMVESGIIEFSLDSFFTDGLELPLPQPWILRLNK